ncbi:MAG: xanthine dehydrogenase family protein, partial [Nitrospinaceae bacterium]|nr:xanthine dehydrogenase family protein [Nitrospinaceae bacterium]
MSQMTHVGSSPAKEDALAKAVGDTVYGDDLRLPNELVGKVIRPPAVPANIKKIDASKALALPGVHCVLTAKDIPGENAGRYPYFPVLAEGSVCFGGDAVAILAAETHDIAEQAARLVQIDYEPLPGNYEYENIEGEVLFEQNVEKGDVEAGFAQADVIVEKTYFAASIDHGFIEPEGGVGWVDERGIVNIRVPTQTVENYELVAATLNLPASRVRYDCPMVGGAFGGKEHPLLGAFLGLLTMKTGRPVRIVYSREESMAQCSKKHPFIMRYKTGATKEGKLTALEIDIIADAGAYPTNSGGMILSGLIVGQGPYEVPNARGHSVAIQTNNPFTESMRGVGANQVCFAYESQMDEVAVQLGMDPVEFRRRNFIEKGGTLIHRQPIPTSPMLHELLAQAERAIGKKAGPDPSNSRGPWRRGVGYIGNLAGYGRPNQDGETYVSIEADGSVNLRCGASDVGAGQSTTYRQIAAEALGVTLESVSVTMANSEITPHCGMTSGSRQTLITGGAAQRGGEELLSRILKGAAELLEAAVEDLEANSGIISVRGAQERSVRFVEAVKKCKEMGISLFTTAKMETHPHTFEGNDVFGDRGGWVDYSFGVHAAEADVNIETGEVRLLNYVSGHDVGQAIHPQHVEGQFEGGSMMGIGHGLL